MIKKLLLIKNAKQITDTPGFKPLPYIDLNADLHYERECGYPMSVTLVVSPFFYRKKQFKVWKLWNPGASFSQENKRPSGFQQM